MKLRQFLKKIVKVSSEKNANQYDWKNINRLIDDSNITDEQLIENLNIALGYDLDLNQLHEYVKVVK